VYGGDSKFRAPLEDRGQAYVLAVRRNQPLSTWPPYGPPNQWTVAEYAATIPADAWQRLSCGEGAQGPRLYDWAYRPARPATHGPTTDGQPWAHGLLVRRHLEHADELAYYLVYAPTATSLQEMVRAAGARWTIDDMFKLAKGQVGLDHYEVRSWQGWYRHITLVLLAAAFLRDLCVQDQLAAAPSSAPPTIPLVVDFPRSEVASVPGLPPPVVLPLSTVLLAVFIPPGALPLPASILRGSGMEPPPTVPISRLLAIVSPAVVPAGCWLAILL